MVLTWGMALSGGSGVSAADRLVVFSAASLTDAISALITEFERSTNQTTVVSFASTSVLARQIKDGAPAHVFIAANTAWMDDLVASGSVSADTKQTIASNRLALVAAAHVPYWSSEQEGELSTATNITRIAPDLPVAIGNPDHVPLGIYTQQALDRLGYLKRFRSRLVPMPNARSVIASVTRGESALAVVYASDVRPALNVSLIGLFPADSHNEIIYPAAAVADNPHPNSDDFLRFLVSPDAKTVFKQFGFLPPPQARE